MLLGLAAVLLSFLRNRNAVRFRAGKKVVLGAFALLCVVSVARPGVTDRLANAVGVGRGADLLLYLTVLGFLFVSLNSYLKFKDQEARFVLLVRQMAIEQAVRREYDGPRGGDGCPPPTELHGRPHPRPQLPGSRPQVPSIPVDRPTSC